MREGAVGVRRASLGDLPFVMATERIPAFEPVIGRWSEAEHKAALANPTHAYLIGTNAAGVPEGFAILRDVGSAHGNVCLQRVAVAEPGSGFGSALLRGVVDWSFLEANAYRLWLDVLHDNARARHVYGRLGFVEEGRLRAAHPRADGSRADLVVMSLLRPEWLARRSGSG